MLVLYKLRCACVYFQCQFVHVGLVGHVMNNKLPPHTCCANVIAGEKNPKHEVCVLGAFAFVKQ